MRINYLLISLLFLITFCSAQQKSIPRYKDYPATEFHAGNNAPLALTKADKAFRTRLSEAAKQRPNFAGHFILTAWGCGTECLMGAVIDAKTGKVYWIPHSICCWGIDVDDKFNPIEYRLESTLLILSGMKNEQEGTDAAHFYRFTNGRFVLLRSIKKKLS